MKKILTMFLAVSICFTFTISSFATENGSTGEITKQEEIAKENIKFESFRKEMIQKSNSKLEKLNSRSEGLIYP